ncbi:PIGF/3-ketodihydrosphingosine reductase fusion protein-like [Cornus florida]|uniref:PIGF/3-ketodihydrosphingosine reductase fusion protein-like n=1 Tax=Cornus florida TaxID=4283 RepID=UPI00289B6EAF|nr:PIGF/3-ketodihydrosphingosine reductase fusion protein-like [Cornus florida]
MLAALARKNKMEEEKKNQTLKASKSRNDTVQPPSPSPSQEFLLHLICGLGLASAFWVARNLYSINLVTHTSQTLRLIWVIEAPIVILLYSLFRQNPNQCSYLKAVGRGMLGLPAGAVVNALGAIALGAPVGIQYFSKTLNWSLLMSLLTFVPAASVFGSSWTDWQRIFAHTKPIGSIDFMICLPAHGAVIGAWLGAWPMPLDWERPWQEWPICVSYGAMAGYLVSMVVSFGFVLLRGGKHRVKGD